MLKFAERLEEVEDKSEDFFTLDSSLMYKYNVVHPFVFIILFFYTPRGIIFSQPMQKVP